MPRKKEELADNALVLDHQGETAEVLPEDSGTAFAGVENLPAPASDWESYGPVEKAASPEAVPVNASPAGQNSTENLAPEPSDRQKFYALPFNELDRYLTPAERQEWNTIYASYRGRSVMHGTVIGVDPYEDTHQRGERRIMNCAVIIPYLVRIVIPETEIWEQGHERPDFVTRGLSGAEMDFIITKVDREGGFAVASRQMAARSRRYFFSHRPDLHREGARITCRLLTVGPRRCLADCYGYDIELTQRDLSYSAIPDLRNDYHPGMELPCIVKEYLPDSGKLRISVKETEANPFEGAELRHPVGSRRIAKISGKYGGGVFCNLPDGTVCMCSYSYQHQDSDFLIGDTVIVVIQNINQEKKQIYGKILSKW